MKNLLKSLMIFLVIVLSVNFLACKDNDNDNAKEVYRLLCEVESICVDGMDDIYNAWHFGIYDAEDCYISTVFSSLANKVSFSKEELSTNGGYTAIQLIYGSGSIQEWQYCVWTIENCLSIRGDYSSCDSKLEEAKSIISDFSSKYEYKLQFQDLYGNISAYVEFFKEPTGSFNQLANTTQQFEDSIKKSKALLSFAI